MGLFAAADRLADEMLPGLTARMSRARFLTILSVAAEVLQGIEERAPDGTSPQVVLEWVLVQAFARTSSIDTRGVPGIAKARAAAADKAPMSAGRYLKTATTFGFHGVYKTLAQTGKPPRQGLGLIDDDMRLQAEGGELVRAWEQAQGLDGFSRPGDKGRARRQRELLRSAVLDALKAGYARPPTPAIQELVTHHMDLGAMSVAEAEVVKRYLRAPSGGTRGEVFELMATDAVHDVARTAADTHEWDAQIAAALYEAGSEELRRKLEAIRAYEDAVRPLQDALDWIRHLSTAAHFRDVTADEFVKGAPNLVRGLPDALAKAEEALQGTTAMPLFLEILKRFADVTSMRTLFERVLTHHDAVQGGKPPHGRRSWFEKTSRGGYAVRPLYRLDKPPPTTTLRFVHQYRFHAVNSFLRDLGEVDG